MKHFETMTHHVVRRPWVTWVRGPTDGREHLDNVNEHILGSTKGENHRYNGRFRGP